MDIKIISKHIEITDDIRTKIEDKVSGLPKFYNIIMDVEVIVEGGKDGLTNGVELIVRARHNHTFVAKQTGQDMLGCIEEAVRKIETQLKKQKEKERDNKYTRKTEQE